MEREQRCAVLAQDSLVARDLARTVLESTPGDIAVILPPTVGMVMVRVTDSAKGEVFNLGEALVTEARVSLNGTEGWSMVMGNDSTHALAAAIVDAALAEDVAGSPALIAELERAAGEQGRRRQVDWERVAPTRVDFQNF